MIVLFNKFLGFASGLLLLASCSNHPKSFNVLSKLEAKAADTVDLSYNPRHADRKIDAFITNLHTHRGFNGNILVAKNGHIIYQKSIGWADYLHRDSLNINSRFQLASVSKPLTATAILMLYEQHKLRLDDDITRFIPTFPNKGITVRMLLSHTSGLNNYQYFCEKHCDRKTPIYNTDVVDMYAQYKPQPYSKPGNFFFYCNTNFMLLGLIVEKVAHMPYAKFMKKYVFEPAGMKNTVVYSKKTDAKVPTPVWGYDHVWRRSVVPNYLDGVIGDKGIYSTVTDLYSFDQALNAGKLLKPQTLAMAYAPSSGQPKHHKHFGYGLGWRLFEGENGKNVIYHTGWWHGFQNIFVRDLDKHVTIVILSNVFNGSIAQLDDLYNQLGVPVIRKGAYAD